MAYGLFGKLPQKRDFVALGLPRSVLEPFEAWLQSAVAASRSELGSAWQEAYLVAPIWRFWIGRSILGTSCAGALMPSVDRVGRFFPLSILYLADGGREIDPPLFAPLDEWYGAIEARLLTVLDGEAAVEVESLTEGLVPPDPAPDGSGPQGRDFCKGMVWHGENGGAGALLATLIPADCRALAPGRSFWWTDGGRSGGSLVYARNGLPDPFFFTSMITGELDRRSRTGAELRAS